MHKPITKACLFLVALTLSSMVSATGLGKFTLSSYLGQSLKAEIDLVSVKKEDITSLKVSLASSDTFSLANVAYAPFLDTLEFSIQNRTNGQFYVRIISSEPILEPSFNILIKLDWPTGNLIREYTVFLESPNEPLQPTSPEIKAASDISSVTKSEGSAVKQLDSVVENLISEEELAIEEESISDHRAAEEDLSESEIVTGLEGPVKLVEPKFDVTTYGPVKKGDTLFKIIRDETSYNVQLNQLLIGIYRANPEAFSDNNMNQLKIGFILRIPNESEVATISTDMADKEVKMHTANWEAYRQKLATDVISVPLANNEPAQTATGEITTIMNDNSTETVHDSSEGVLRLSKGVEEWGIADVEASDEGSTNIQEKFNIVEENSIASEKALNEASERISLLEHAIEENRIANQKELNESNQRIIALEKTVKELQQLLKLKNSIMADAEVQAENILSATSEPPPVIEEKPIKVVRAPIESVKGEESNLTIIKWVSWIIIFLVAVGLWLQIKQSRAAKNSKTSDTI